MPAPTSLPAPLNCLVVDDDDTARTVMARYVSRHEDLALVGLCSDADEATDALHDREVDVVVLDIEMPGMSGLELADIEIMHGLDTRPQVVFVTAKEDYAVEAFSVDATDYMVKPVRYARFEEAIRRVKRLYAADAVLAAQTDDDNPDAGSPTAASPTAASPNTASSGEDPEADGKSRQNGSSTSPSGAPDAGEETADDSVFIKVDGRLIRLDLDELMWVEAQRDYMLLTTTSSRYLIHSTMKALAEKLPATFVRVHRSFIVNLDAIKDIEDTTLVIDRKVIPIGASYRDELMDRLNTL
jgi:DNA-binding LytR/AlgR family response regulator